MRFLIAGASGFLGSALVDRLRAGGHEVVRLVRRETAGSDELAWDPAAGRLEAGAVVGADAAVNLAGAGVGDRRWTEAYKKLLRSSRVDTTTTLARAIADTPAGQRPPVLLNASAVGWYGDTGDREVDETVPAAAGFLPDLCREWEAATEPAEAAGVRVVRMRTGFPLRSDGGLLKPMLLPFRLGLGGRLGSGRQWIPWISMPDWLDAVQLLLDREDLAGPVNLVGPAPVTNADFTRALGEVLGRPTVLPVPAPVLRAAIGEFGNEAVASQRVVPGVLTGAGFTYSHPDVRSALRVALA